MTCTFDLEGSDALQVLGGRKGAADAPTAKPDEPPAAPVPNDALEEAVRLSRLPDPR